MANPVNAVKNLIYLAIAIVVAGFGLQFGLYGLIVNTLGGYLKPTSIQKLATEGAGTDRYIELTDAVLWDIEMGYYNDMGQMESHLYIATLPDTTKLKTAVVIVESTDDLIRSNDSIIGLLKPFWTPLDEDIDLLLYHNGFELNDPIYHLECGREPWNWYWNLLILFISGLFIYRLIEAIIVGIRARKQKWSERKNHQLTPPESEPTMNEIEEYHNSLSESESSICDKLKAEIDNGLPEAESKIWHGHPVWFLDGNPIVGYNKQKAGIRLMFWSGASFDEEGLKERGAKFKDASIFYNSAEEINHQDLHRWLVKSRNIQWDYKNIVKRKGVLERLK